MALSTAQRQRLDSIMSARGRELSAETEALVSAPSEPRRRRERLPAAEMEGELSQREQEILQHVADGLTNAEIGDCLCLSEHTIKTYLKQAFARLGANSRASAVAIAFRSGHVV